MQTKLTVTQLNEYVAGMFDDEFVLHNIVVAGEIASINITANKTYYTLTDNECSMSCMCFYALNDLSVGDKVEASGKVTFYKKNSRITFFSKQVNKSGEGDEHAEFLKLKAKLKEEGLFDNKLELPKIINKICVITSESGAVIHDIMSVVRKKNFTLNVAVYDVRVQGENSASSIASAIKMINQYPNNCDAVILARGGGSAQDLQSFNTELVARSVAESKLPIVSAIGHDSDYTLCDLCASLRAGTPSIAADMVTSPLSDKINKMYSYLSYIDSAVSAKYASILSELRYNTSNLTSLTKLTISKKTDSLQRNISNAYNVLSNKANMQNENLNKQVAVLDKLSPLKVLARGYTKISKDNVDISSAEMLSNGDNIKIIFGDGTKNAEIK